MSEEDLEEKVKTMLNSFNDQQRMLFAYSCCMRVYPNYVFFCKEENWGDTTPFEEALVTIKSYCLNKTFISDVSSLAGLVEENIPDVDDFEETVYAWFAQDAGICIHSALEYIRYKTLKNLLMVSEFCLTIVRDYLENIKEVEDVESHKLFKREIKKQIDDLKLISEAQIDDKLLVELTSFNNGKSNINL